VLHVGRGDGRFLRTIESWRALAPQLSLEDRFRYLLLPWLYMTAFSLVDIQNQQIGLEPGVPILPKPFRVDVLTKKVREVLAEPAPSRSNPFAPARPFAPALR
jgi:hypothetical protein